MDDHSGHRAPAPGRLALIQALVNSADLETGDDELGSVADAVAWARRHAAPGGLGEQERRRLVAVREALREALGAHAGGEVALSSGDALSRLLGVVPLRARVSPEGAVLAPAGDGVDRLLGEVVAAIVEATLDGTWDRLKVCRADRCRFAFYDRSKNGRGAWCSMDVCGNRAKARTYRSRRRADPGG